MRKSILIIFWLLITIGNAGAQGFLRPKPAEPEPPARKTEQQVSLEKVSRVYDIINQNYVDPVNNRALTEQAIIAMLKQLDPHSVYFTAEQIKRANEELEGSFEGIGIEFQYFDDTAVVVLVVSGGPSARAGMKPGDRILRIGNEDATGPKSESGWISKRVRGEKGTPVQITVLRPGIREPLLLTITRDRITTYSVDTWYMTDSQTGYIKISRFMRTTVREFEDALKELKKKNVENLILDLRGNTGGLMNAAIQLADHFLGNNRLIVYTQGLNSARTDYRATGRGDFRKGRLVVLIDENSASASEILTGAIQDWDRGLVMGRRSFGKGLVQKPYPLPDGSTIRLTIARYFTPTGRSIQRPYDKGRDKYFEEMNEKIRRGIYSNIDSLNLHDSLKRITPAGRVVYGGGGILPDILVPADTAKTPALITALNRKNLFYRFALSVVLGSRDSLLREFPAVEVFLASQEQRNMLTEQFRGYATAWGIEEARTDWTRNQLPVERQLATVFAKLLYGNKASVQAQCYFDPLIGQAAQIMQDATASEFYKIQDTN
ncbi:MAG TPA: S41 family peptidase [Bacteroidales bacterium]|nr:S41 family peptidase [Bacteroidales bacterium]HRZ49580.1 S41 family peptidase [Bacteroidales bacterium]